MPASFKYIGGIECLDLVNTVGARVPGRPPHAWRIERDKFGGYDDLLLWAKGAGLVTPEEVARVVRRARAHPAEATAAFERAVALREALHRMFTAAIDGRSPARDDARLLLDEVARARARQRLVVDGSRLAWAVSEPDALDSFFGSVARSAAHLLTSDELELVRRCGGDDCGWLFLDVSRNHARQWCDMRDCGNLAKVRRFRERQRQHKGAKHA